MFWSSGCSNWSDEEFKQRLGIKRESFEYIRGSVRSMILKDSRFPGNIRFYFDVLQ